jgi:hypothetical protein
VFHSPHHRPCLRARPLPASDFSLRYKQLSCQPRFVASRCPEREKRRETGATPVAPSLPGPRTFESLVSVFDAKRGNPEGFPRSHQRKRAARYFLPPATSSSIAVVRDFGRSIA